MMDKYYLMVFGVFLIGLGAVRFVKKSKEEKQALMHQAKKMIRNSLYDLIIAAEKKYGMGTGEVKKAFVINAIKDSAFYVNLPNYIKVFINADVLGEMIDDLVEDTLKPSLQDKDIQRILFE